MDASTPPDSTSSASSPWSAMAGYRAAAPGVGPFPHAAFLEAAEEAVGTRSDAIRVATTKVGAVALVVDDDLIRFAGPEHLTDYHAPLGDDPSVVAETLAPLSNRRFVLDSLPHDVAASTGAAIEALGIEASMLPRESTAVLALPSTHEEWLMSIGKKERHEVRRKRRRFEAEFGEVTIERTGLDTVARFCEMHRTSPGSKGAFMTDTMERFFTRLVTDVGAVIHLLRCGGTVRAAAFGFETDDGYYYYNSAYDPEAAAASPGVVLLSSLIGEQIERGATLFDFLKGDERYKYRHGAVARPLFVLEGRVP